MATASPTPTPTASPTPEPTPTATATASPTPERHRGIELIEPAGEVFEHRTFETGEAIEWAHGAFVLDPVTGRTEGYATPHGGWHGYRHHAGGWIVSGDQGTDGDWHLLLQRETGQMWRWPAGGLRLVAASRDHLLFEEMIPPPPRDSTGRFTLTNRDLEEVGRFAFDVEGLRSYGWFSPSGETIALQMPDAVYLVGVPSAQPVALEASGAGWDSFRLSYGYDGPHIRVHEAEGYRHFSWEGAALGNPACPGFLSPDGRHVAWLDGGPVAINYADPPVLENPWPAVVVADAETCAPLFRVRSAYTSQIFWQADWLASSVGLVVGLRDGFAVARVGPEPALDALPASPPGDHWRAAPEPAPTGGGRYFGYGPMVYDALEDRWTGPADVEWGPFEWGDSHRERWFSTGYWGEGGLYWLLLEPSIELPPFSDEIAFRVAGTGSCLRLREQPGQDGLVTGCLPDGERLLLAQPDESRETPWEVARPFHQSVAELRVRAPEGGADVSWWVYVRAEEGAEGWVSHDYLEHD